MNPQVSQTQTASQSYQRHQPQTRAASGASASQTEAGAPVRDDRVSISEEARERRASEAGNGLARR